MASDKVTDMEEDEMLSLEIDATSETSTRSRSETADEITRLVQEQVKSKLQSFGLGSGLLAMMGKSSQTHIRRILDKWKLQGPKNFIAWQCMVTLDLTAMDLLTFVQEQRAASLQFDPPWLREIKDAQTCQYLQESVSELIVSRIKNMNTAFETYTYLTRMFGGSRTSELVSLHLRMMNLRFKPGYDPDRYVADFEHLIANF